MSEVKQEEKLILLAIYCLSIVTFAFGGTGLIAIVLCLLFKKKVLGTWQESHYRWQLRTLSFSLLGVCISTGLMLSTLVSKSDMATIFTITGGLGLVVVLIWYLYRTIKGLVRYRKSIPMY